MAEKMYEVTYVRKSAKESDVDSKVYSEGHWRKITMMASSEKEALKIAERRLAKQFPERVVVKDSESGDEVVLSEGSLVNGAHDPTSVHSNYKLQGVVVVEQER